ncbi:MAG: hypothetical protein ACRDF4_07605 [Rhabdochlamydiaceae bacterium]
MFKIILQSDHTTTTAANNAIAQQKEELEQQLQNAFEASKVNLYKPKKSEKMALLDQLKKSRLNRNDYLRILENSEAFTDTICKSAGEKHRLQSNKTTLRSVWDKWLDLLGLSLLLKPKEHGFELVRWNEDVHTFGDLFVQRFGSEEVTPYIHVFVCHIGELKLINQHA